ncbi:helix-turn-helix domain-containing protein [Microvirga sp. Mcv34]|uniref:helix-turn-helix domain-containing protein n=1 Tax=Microvirga sp. Mcv34 TaxID=2926016 RepID=UPI0021C91847|nr:helix-turn-helix domain-containing protein [Microvirga sp. Mcv34]
MYASHLAPSTSGAPLPPFDIQAGPSTLASAFASRPMETLAAGEAAFWEGDAASHAVQVVDGCFRLYRILADGRRAIMGFVFAGETLGLSCQGTYRYTAEAITRGQVRRLGRSQLQAMTEGSERLRSLVLAHILEEMNAAHHHIIVLGQMGAEERVAHFLVSAAHRTGADCECPVAIEVPMTRLDIADYLGLTLETVSRVMSRFRRDGLIALEGRSRVVLRRMSRVQELAGEVEEDLCSTSCMTAWPH